MDHSPASVGGSPAGRGSPSGRSRSGAPGPPPLRLRLEAGTLLVATRAFCQSHKETPVGNDEPGSACLAVKLNYKVGEKFELLDASSLRRQVRRSSPRLLPPLLFCLKS